MRTFADPLLMGQRRAYLPTIFPLLDLMEYWESLMKVQDTVKLTLYHFTQ